ncbi:histidine kinase-like ATPase, partial [Hyaloraphidium curvatum]
MDLPEPPDRPGVFGFAAVASRREYWALRQLQRALDSAEAANRAKNTFVATISHELRTPLTAILGFSNLLEGAKGLTPEEAGWVSMIKESGDSLANIIGDLIDVSKIEAGKMDVQLHPFSPREFLSSVHALHAPKTAELGITLDLVIAPADPSVPGSADVPEHIISDELRLRQILGNFLTNSRKFTPSGGHITVTARCFARPLPSPPLPGARRHSINTSATHTLRISVRDDGMGIAPDKIHVLFTEFTPGDASYARLVGGTGLGLFISKRLIGLLGGRIGVDSPDVGRGSEFWIEM